MWRRVGWDLRGPLSGCWLSNSSSSSSASETGDSALVTDLLLRGRRLLSPSAWPVLFGAQYHSASATHNSGLPISASAGGHHLAFAEQKTGTTNPEGLVHREEGIRMRERREKD